MADMKAYVQEVLEKIAVKDPQEKEFQDTAKEILTSITPVLEAHPEYKEERILERFVEPERVILFRVPWADDKGHIQVNRGFRVQMSSAIGPYKGGLRFHPSVNLSILKFLATEQVLKNALSTLPIGGGKGGADFDPKGKSDGEVMRQYKRLTGHYEGVLTGKGLTFGGSLARTEATGYGLLYFVKDMLDDNGIAIKGATVAVSGAGNVAIYAIEKAQAMGAKVVTCSDSNGYIYDPAGIDLALLKDIKEVRRGRVKEYAATRSGAEYHEGCTGVWSVKCDIALPCATQNELDLDSAKALVANGVKAVGEGANMPSTLDAVEYLQKNGVLFAPAKAANAGGVSVSALEMSQNSERLSWTFEEVDQRLRGIMDNIYAQSKSAAEKYGAKGNLLAGANMAGFVRVAQAMHAQGWV